MIFGFLPDPFAVNQVVWFRKELVIRNSKVAKLEDFKEEGMNMKNKTIHMPKGYVLMLFLVIMTCNVNGATYYVSTTGNDANPGTVNQPWKTIQKAANTVVDGDTVIINAGTYNEQVTITKVGTATAPITFKGETSGGPASMPVIDGQSIRNWCIYIDGSYSPGDKYIVIDSIKIRNAVRDGIRVSMADRVTIKNCIAADNQLRGIFTDYTNYCLVESCESYGAKNEHGIYFSNSSDYCTARRNLLYNNAACGIHNNGDKSMTARAGSDGINHNGLIERNIIYSNGQPVGGAGVNIDGCEDYIVRNNLIYNNYASGITSYYTDGASSKIIKFIIIQFILSREKAGQLSL